jgi:hypothetical protein
MAKPTTEGDSLRDSKISHKLLKVAPLRASADKREVSQIISQKRGSRTQTEVASFSANEAARENQLKFGAGLRPAPVGDTQGTSNAILRDKKRLVAVRGKLGPDVGHSEDDRCRVAIGGPSKRQKPGQFPQAKELLVRLAKAGRIPQTSLERPEHEGYGPFAQEESERTRQHCRHRQKAQNDIELARKDTAPQLSPGTPFKGKSKRIDESGQQLSVKVVFEDPAHNPGIDALEQWHPDHLDGAKRCLGTAHTVFNGRSYDQGDVMELGERCRMTVADKRNADGVWITVRPQKQNT